MWTPKTDKKLTAGLLIRDVPVFSSLSEEGNFTKFPFSIILTQACDLESYYRVIEAENSEGNKKNRQMITQILFIPAFEEEPFKKGEHFREQYGIILEDLHGSYFDRIRSSQDFRYHFIKSNTNDIPNLYIDFKHYYTTPLSLVTHVVASQEKAFYELEIIQYADLADRFANYLQRVPTP